jgi:AraC-like DNA-binding protein
MIVFEIQHTDNKSLLRMIGAVMNIPYSEEDCLTLIPPAGIGTIKVIELADELQVMLANVEFMTHFIAKRKHSENRFYVLHFDDVYISGTATFTVDEERIEKKQSHLSVARLTSNVFTNAEEVSAHTRVKSVKVFFSEDWLKKYLGLDDTVDGLQKYISLKTACFDIEPLDTEYLRLMDELLNAPKDDPLQNIFLKNRATLLIERFFTRLAEKMKKWEGRADISPQDMECFLKIQRLLIKEVSEKPPTIEQLAKMVAMSATRLKKGFKEMYGMGIYTYYQKARLQKAKELLMSGSLTIKETAAATGFYNTLSFVNAFKKEFNILPSQLVNDR